MSEPLILDGSNWYCALRDIKIHANTLRDMYVYCDIIKDSYVLGSKLPILQRIAVEEGGRVIKTYDSSISFKVTRPLLSTVTVYIKKDEEQVAPSFPDEPTTCTLHIFKKTS